jgi:hypothetical protein
VLADGLAAKGDVLLALLSELDITPHSYSQQLQRLLMDVSESEGWSDRSGGASEAACLVASTHRTICSTHTRTHTHACTHAHTHTRTHTHTHTLHAHARRRLLTC